MAARITHPCPRCGRTLMQSGERIIDDLAARSFQCDDCVVDVNFEGRVLPLAFFFCLDDNGQVFDPDAPDGKLRF